MNPLTKLSELILLGIGDTTQCFGKLYVPGEGGKVVQTCALGAARQGAGEILSALFPHEDLVWNGPSLEEGDFHIPGCFKCHRCWCKKGGSLGLKEEKPHFHLRSVLVHLNDHMKWSREKIAEYISPFGF